MTQTPRSPTLPAVASIHVIAIDGPSGSGKGTIARRVASRLGFHLLDSGDLYRLVDLAGTRKAAELLLPQLVRFTPWLLSIYMNPEVTDTSAARELVKTVEDPNRAINREIALWIRNRDLVLRGTNVSDALRRVTCPLLCVFANGDGIVPRDTATFPYHQIGSPQKALLEVGSDDCAMAHADLFVSRECHRRVFAPVAAWLADQRS